MVSTIILDGEKKKVVLAMPVEVIAFEGLKMKACMVQLNIDEMLSSLTLQGGDNETYCNLYYQDGESLTSDDFGYLTAGKNVLSELSNGVVTTAMSANPSRKAKIACGVEWFDIFT